MYDRVVGIGELKYAIRIFQGATPPQPNVGKNKPKLHTLGHNYANYL